MNRFFKTVLLTGLFVGTTDLIAAYVTQWIKTGAFSEKMLLYIAGGALGLEASMQGGNGVAFLGLLFHYFIAFAFTLFFFIIFPRLKFLSFNKYLVGMLYGVFVSEAMSNIILPLSALPASPFNLSRALIGWYTLGVVLGIPIVYNAYKYYGVASTDSSDTP
ncbi:MAG TPA: hypothetical protein VGK59_13720 [Ohtaekwangia sp.]